MDGQNPTQPVIGGYPNQQVAPVISMKEWMLTILLLAIPLVNIIMLFVWAFGGGANPSKANYAKASLLWVLIAIGLYVIFFVIIFGAIMSSMR
jgi:succinate dehydrogenase/fumarate reductase cytochrome b subunit